MSDFVYSTYIKSTPEKVWSAIVNPEFTRQYWGYSLISDWKEGAAWKSVKNEDGTVGITGEVVECVPPRRLVLTWVNHEDAQDVSRATFQIEAMGDMVRLTVLHGGFKQGSKMAERVAMGWPRVLSSMKTLLETGAALDTWAGMERCQS